MYKFMYDLVQLWMYSQLCQSVVLAICVQYNVTTLSMVDNTPVLITYIIKQL